MEKIHPQFSRPILVLLFVLKPWEVEGLSRIDLGIEDDGDTITWERFKALAANAGTLHAMRAGGLFTTIRLPSAHRHRGQC